MKKSVDFFQVLNDYHCPFCGSEVEFTEWTMAYQWDGQCCGHRFILTPTKASLVCFECQPK